ncbi:hypothetical protein ED733_000023, partial [Metarhizium rileyi]
MRLPILPLVFGLASAAVRGGFPLADDGALEKRTFDLDGILGDISHGGLDKLEGGKISILCKAADKAESISGFCGKLKIEKKWKKKLEKKLKDKCK